MATIQETGQTQTHVGNNGEAQSLAPLVRELQNECVELRLALAQMQKERNWYRQAIYENSRATREFENVDIPALEAISVGPVEVIK